MESTVLVRVARIITILKLSVDLQDTIWNGASSVEL